MPASRLPTARVTITVTYLIVDTFDGIRPKRMVDEQEFAKLLLFLQSSLLFQIEFPVVSSVSKREPVIANVHEQEMTKRSRNVGEKIGDSASDLLGVYVNKVNMMRGIRPTHCK